MHQEDAVPVANDDVRDELLVRRILLCGRTRDVPPVLRHRIAQEDQTFLAGRADAVKA
jgi:hypothetical protein